MRHSMIVLVLTLTAVFDLNGKPSSGGAANPEIVLQMSGPSVDPIPEPLSMAFLGVGLLVFGAVLRRHLRA
jgi:hypothetical protein